MGKIFLVIVGFVPHIIPIYLLSTSELGVGLHEDLSDLSSGIGFQFQRIKICMFSQSTQ